MNATEQVRAEAKKDPDVLQREIAATRADVDQTLSELQARLSPGQLLDQTLGYVRAHGGEMVRNLGGAAKQNPMPLLLTGIGLAWLIASQRSSRNYDPSMYVSTEEEMEGDSPGLAEKLKAGASSMKERVTGAKESMAQGMQHAREGMYHASEQARMQAQRARENFDRMMQEQPLMLGALGVALGALIGATLPTTQKEEQLLDTLQ